MTQRPGPSGTIGSVTRFGYTLLVFASRLPRTALFLGVLAFTLLGLFLPGLPGAVLLLVLAAAAAAVLALTWPRVAPQRRGLNVVVLLIVVGLAVSKLF